MQKKSIVYKNIHIYRAIMNLLYFGRYKKRFSPILRLIDDHRPRKVVELCFGDLVIAEHCKKNKISWKGYDVNPSFIRYATQHEFNAINLDLRKLEDFEPCDIIVMAGSLYHFHDIARKIINKMLDCSALVIISEPIINLSTRQDLLGKIAQRSAKINNKHCDFRYSEESFMYLLDELKQDLQCEYSILSKERDIVVKLNKI